MRPALRVIEPGLAATLQDGGRWGYQRFGVPVSGALDDISRQVGNILVGNAPGAAALEILGAACVLEVEAGRARLALAGAAPPFILQRRDASVRIPAFQSALAVRGDIVRLAPPKDGAVYYLGVEGGFDVPPALGSLSTYRRAKLGGLEGRALAAGDRLPLCLDEAPERGAVALDLALPAPGTLRIMRGPNAEFFSGAAFEALFSSAYAVSPSSDRMGLRLQGAPLSRENKAELLPQGTTAGALQVPADGQPILLLADRQTTGGYPRIGTVIGADIAAAGRLAAGMVVRFQEASREEAVRALQEQRAFIAALPSRLRPVAADALSAEQLLSHNLIGGVTAGSPDEQ